MERFNIKQDAGGIVDIEFIVQYLILLHASEFPDLMEYSDNIRQLEAIERRDLLDKDSVALLQEAYIAYRTLGHRLSLQGLDNVVENHEIMAYREPVRSVWTRIML